MKPFFLALSFCAALCAQSIPVQTTLAVPAGAGDLQLQLASAAGISPGNLLFIDREALVVNQLSGAAATVRRGAVGTRATAHNAGVAIYAGPPSVFVEIDPAGACAVAAAAILINTKTGNVSACNASTLAWVTTSPNTGGGGGGCTIGTTAGTCAAGNDSRIVGALQSLPIASSSSLGGMKCGAGVACAGDGTASVSTAYDAAGAATAAQAAAIAASVVPVFGASGTSHATGRVPDPGVTAGVTRYLREDGTFSVPPGGSASPGGASGTLQFNNSGAFGGLAGTSANNSCPWGGCLGLSGSGSGNSPIYIAPPSYDFMAGGGSATNGSGIGIEANLSVFGSADSVQGVNGTSTVRAIDAASTLTGSHTVATLSGAYVSDVIGMSGTGDGGSVAHWLGVVSRLQYASAASNTTVQDGTNYYGDYAQAAGSVANYRGLWIPAPALTGTAALTNYYGANFEFSQALTGSATLANQSMIMIGPIGTAASNSNQGITVGGPIAGNYSIVVSNYDGNGSYPVRFDKPLTSSYSLTATSGNDSWLSLASGNGIYATAANSGSARAIDLLMTDNHGGGTTSEFEGMNSELTTNGAAISFAINYVARWREISEAITNLYGYDFEDSTVGRGFDPSYSTTHMVAFHVANKANDGQAGDVLYRTGFTAGHWAFAFQNENPLMVAEFQGPGSIGKAYSGKSSFGVGGLATYASDSAAGTAGLTAGDFYIDSTGVVHAKQ